MDLRYFPMSIEARVWHVISKNPEPSKNITLGDLVKESNLSPYDNIVVGISEVNEDINKFYVLRVNGEVEKATPEDMQVLARQVVPKELTNDIIFEALQASSYLKKDIQFYDFTEWKNSLPRRAQNTL